MAEAPPTLDAPVADAVRGRGVPCALVGAAVFAAALVVGICVSETPTATSSPCGTCRSSAREAVYGWAKLGVALAALAALLARFEAPGAFRVARSAALVALASWLMSVGFIRGWW
jgi:hypothetical protein